MTIFKFVNTIGLLKQYLLNNVVALCVTFTGKLNAEHKGSIFASNRFRYISSSFAVGKENSFSIIIFSFSSFSSTHSFFFTDEDDNNTSNAFFLCACLRSANSFGDVNVHDFFCVDVWKFIVVVVVIIIIIIKLLLLMEWVKEYSQQNNKCFFFCVFS